MNYEVKFEANGGTIEGSTLLLTEDGYFLFPEINSRDGYDLLGWSLDENDDGTHLFTEADMPISEDITLYAIWKPISCTFIFLNKDESTLATKYFDYNYKATKKDFPTPPEIKGNDFDGWYMDKDLKDPYLYGTEIRSSMTLYPKYSLKQITISYIEPNNYVTPVYKTYSYGSTIEEPTDLDTWPGHSLRGFYADSARTIPYEFGQPAIKDTVIYLLYGAILYNVRFLSENGTELSPTKRVDYGSIISKPNDPVKEGFYFKGWYNGETKFDFSLPITKDLDLLAQWERMYCKVRFFTTFDIEIVQDDIKAKIVPYGDLLEQPGDYFETGYTFVCWSTTKNAANKFDFTKPIKSDTKLYAITTINKVPVNYIVDNQIYESLTLDYGSHAPAGIKIPTKENYYFSGWMDKDGNPFDFLAPILVETNIYAAFQKMSTVVVFNTVGGNTIMPVTVSIGMPVEQPDDPTKTGYTFKAWYSDSSYKNLYDFNSVVTDTLILYARWDVNRYDVTFKYGDGSSDQIVRRYAYGSKVTRPTDPVRPGYIFVRWLKPNGNEFDFTEEKVTGPLTLNADWKLNESSVYGGSFLAMINSNEYYSGTDVNNALLALFTLPIEDIDFSLYKKGKSGVDSSTSQKDAFGNTDDDAVDVDDSDDDIFNGITVDQFYIIYNWAKGYQSKLFSTTKSYQFSFDEKKNQMSYKVKEVQYAVPLSNTQLNNIVGKMYGYNVSQTDCTELASYLINWHDKFSVYYPS